ncbi:MAG: hypothetical protein ACE5JX_15295, partial [Acidobacteriota bacterium]
FGGVVLEKRSQIHGGRIVCLAPLLIGGSYLQCLEPLANVTFVGENTEGGSWDTLWWRLPGGRHFWFGNKVYSNHQGRNYERWGFPRTSECQHFSKTGSVGWTRRWRGS